MYLTNNKPGLSNLFVLVFLNFLALLEAHLDYYCVSLAGGVVGSLSLSLSLSLSVHWSPAPKDDLE
jgi:hypothetical protein